MHLYYIRFTCIVYIIHLPYKHLYVLYYLKTQIRRICLALSFVTFSDCYVTILSHYVTLLQVLTELVAKQQELRELTEYNKTQLQLLKDTALEVVMQHSRIYSSQNN